MNAATELGARAMLHRAELRQLVHVANRQLARADSRGLGQTIAKLAELLHVRIVVREVPP